MRACMPLTIELAEEQVPASKKLTRPTKKSGKEKSNERNPARAASNNARNLSNIDVSDNEESGGMSLHVIGHFT